MIIMLVSYFYFFIMVQRSYDNFHIDRTAHDKARSPGTHLTPHPSHLQRSR